MGVCVCVCACVCAQLIMDSYEDKWEMQQVSVRQWLY